MSPDGTMNFAATRRVNPPGVEPVLSLEQVWRGLELKAHEPKDFIPGVVANDVIQSEGPSASPVYRKLTFEGGGHIEEEIGMYKNTVVYLDSNKGHRITNMISYDEEENLLLTFSFANGGVPGGLAGSASTPEELNKVCGNFLDSALRKFRELALAGEL